MAMPSAAWPDTLFGLAAGSTLFPSRRESTNVHAQARHAGTETPADTIAPTHGLPRDSRSWDAGAGEHRGAIFDVWRQGVDLRGLQPGLRLHSKRARVLRIPRLHGAAPVPVLPRKPQGGPWRHRWQRLRQQHRLRRQQWRLRWRRWRRDIPAVPARCSRRPAPIAARRHRSPSGPRAASPSTAATASPSGAPERRRQRAARKGPPGMLEVLSIPRPARRGECRRDRSRCP